MPPPGTYATECCQAVRSGSIHGLRELGAIGFPIDTEVESWAVRPLKAPKRQLPRYEPEDEWITIGDQRMSVVGYTAGGAPYEYVEDMEYGEPF